MNSKLEEIVSIIKRKIFKFQFFFFRFGQIGAIDGALTRDQFFEIFVRAREEAVRRQLELRQLFKQFDPGRLLFASFSSKILSQ